MLSLRGLAIAAVALVGAVSAAPWASDINAREIESTNTAQASGNLFVTVDANWEGENANFPFTIGAGNNVFGPCLNLEFDFNDSITSVGPDQLFYCQLYIDANCGGGTPYQVNYPGTPQLPSAYNDKISSFRCAHVDNVG